MPPYRFQFGKTEKNKTIIAMATKYQSKWESHTFFVRMLNRLGKQFDNF